MSFLTTEFLVLFAIFSIIFASGLKCILPCVANIKATQQCLTSAIMNGPNGNIKDNKLTVNNQIYPVDNLQYENCKCLFLPKQYLDLQEDQIIDPIFLKHTDDKKRYILCDKEEAQYCCGKYLSK